MEYYTNLKLFIRTIDNSHLKKSKLNINIDVMIDFFDIFNHINTCIYVQHAVTAVTKKNKNDGELHYINNNWIDIKDYLNKQIISNKYIQNNHKILVYKTLHDLINKPICNYVSDKNTIIDLSYRVEYDNLVNLIDEYYQIEKDICIKLICVNHHIKSFLSPHIIEFYKDDPLIKELIINKCPLIDSYKNKNPYNKYSKNAIEYIKPQLLKVTSIEEDVLNYDTNDVIIYYGYSELTIEGSFFPIHQNILVCNDLYVPYIVGKSEYGITLEYSTIFYKPIVIDNNTYLLMGYFLPSFDNINFGSGIYIDTNLYSRDTFVFDVVREKIRINSIGGWYDHTVDNTGYKYICSNCIYRDLNLIFQ